MICVGQARIAGDTAGDTAGNIAGDTAGDNATKSKKPRQQGVGTTGADNADIADSVREKLGEKRGWLKRRQMA